MSMARRQYSSCRTVRRMGTLAPALSHPSGQEFLRRDRGAVVFWRLVMALAPQRESRGTAPLARRAAGGRQRNPNTGAPPDGR